MKHVSPEDLFFFFFFQISVSFHRKIMAPKLFLFHFEINFSDLQFLLPVINEKGEKVRKVRRKKRMKDEWRGTSIKSLENMSFFPQYRSSTRNLFKSKDFLLFPKKKIKNKQSTITFTIITYSLWTDNHLILYLCYDFVCLSFLIFILGQHQTTTSKHTHTYTTL